jgi:acetoin utilization deacetylase AcuC-like enzyme
MNARSSPGWDPFEALKTVYSVDMVAESGRTPSAGKPALVAQALRDTGWPIELVAPTPLALEALYRVHDVRFVDAILELRTRNGFGTVSESVARSLRFTCGAFHTGALLALQRGLSASLTSGFHHASTCTARGYCTFNGLMASAVTLLLEERVETVAIVDCDYHFGDGTQDIIDALGLAGRVLHWSFGRDYKRPSQALEYLRAIRALRQAFEVKKPDIIFYQAGADVHVDDPLGGLLTTEEMRERDRVVFSIARDLAIPLTWNLAGGYQIALDGSIPRVIELHLNTFQEALRSWRVLC